MDQSAVQKILDIQDALCSDPQYQALMEEYRVLSARFLSALHTMDESQKAAVMDYLGVAVEMHLRMLELACQ